MRAGVALGSNLGDRLSTLVEARRRIMELPSVRPPLLCSSVYETAPIDCEPDAGRFLNAVIEFAYLAEPLELLAGLREIEIALGREPQHVRNTSRTLDLDLLYLGDRFSDIAELQLPHPRMHTRRFVLEPLVEIRPDLVLANRSETVGHLLTMLPDHMPLLRTVSKW